MDDLLQEGRDEHLHLRGVVVVGHQSISCFLNTSNRFGLLELFGFRFQTEFGEAGLWRQGELIQWAFQDQVVHWLRWFRSLLLCFNYLRLLGHNFLLNLFYFLDLFDFLNKFFLLFQLNLFEEFSNDLFKVGVELQFLDTRMFGRDRHTVVERQRVEGLTMHHWDV